MAAILVVDDEQDSLDSVVRGLRLEGYKDVTAMVRSTEVPALLEQKVFDCALLDITMPDLDGMALLQLIKEKSPRTECIMVTAQDSVPLVVRAMKLGAYDYLLKPTTPEDLSRALERALERQRLLEAMLLRGSEAQEGTLSNPDAFKSFITADPSTIRLLREAELHAASRIPVLITGETGAGKEVLANAIHKASRVANGPFVAINMLAVAPTLFEAEFFGHAKGAFTGADRDRPGYLARAKNGTLFLDEIESLHPEAQAFLLDLLDGTGNFAPLGAPGNHFLPPPTFRLISASKRPLRQSALREDLCNRLARGGIILVPGLDERREDIPQLVESFLARANAEQRMNVRFDPEAVSLLQAQEWPDHVRGLEGVVLLLAELAHAKSGGGGRAEATGVYRQVSGRQVAKRKAPAVVTAEDVREHMQSRAAAFGSIPHPPVLPPPPARLELESSRRVMPAAPQKRPKDYTRAELETALEAYGGNLTRTARSLGMVVNTLKSRMAELGLRRG